MLLHQFDVNDYKILFIDQFARYIYAKESNKEYNVTYITILASWKGEISRLILMGQNFELFSRNISSGKE